MSPPVWPDASRQKVLEALEGSTDGLDAGQIAERARLHPNTVRFHLAALKQARRVEERAEKRLLRGRPRLLYSLIPGSETAAPDRGYRLLAEILASFLASSSPDPAQMAIAAGEAWGRYLADRPLPFSRVTAEEATRMVLALLAKLGFDPETEQEEGKTRILLHRCPFRDVARSNAQVACSVHLGLLRGALKEMGAPLRATRLEPMVAPTLCIAHLAPKEPQEVPA